MTGITDDGVRERLEDAVSSFAERAGTRKAWSDAHGIDASYTSQILTGKRRASEEVLAALGLRRIGTIRIEPIKEGAHMGRKGEELLRSRIDDMLSKHGSQKNWAEHLGVSRAFVCKVVSGEKRPNFAMLREMGLVIVREERIEETKA